MCTYPTYIFSHICSTFMRLSEPDTDGGQNEVKSMVTWISTVLGKSIVHILPNWTKQIPNPSQLLTAYPETCYSQSSKDAKTPISQHRPIHVFQITFRPALTYRLSLVTDRYRKLDSGPQKSISSGKSLGFLVIPKKHIHWTPGPKKAYPLDSGFQKSISMGLRVSKKHIHGTPGSKKAYPLDSGLQKSISSGKSLGFLVSQKSISIGLRVPKKHIHWTPGPKKAYPSDSGFQKSISMGLRAPKKAYPLDSGPQKKHIQWQIPWFSGIPKKHIYWTPGPKKAYPMANPLVFWYPKTAYPLDSGPQKSTQIDTENLVDAKGGMHFRFW